MVPAEEYTMIRVFNFSNVNHVASYEQFANNPNVHMEELKSGFDQFNRYSVAYRITLPKKPAGGAYGDNTFDDDPFDSGIDSFIDGGK